jgi:hypothetical protein
MPIDFTVAKSKRELHKSRRLLHFPEKIHSYFIACQNDFSNYPVMLNGLTDIGDTLLSAEDMGQLQKFCGEIKAVTETVYDYRLFDKWKSFGIRHKDLNMFAGEFYDLIKYALDNGEQVWAIGE